MGARQHRSNADSRSASNGHAGRRSRRSCGERRLSKHSANQIAATPTVFEPQAWQLRTRTLTNERRTLIMGVLNVTPDSFSDGGSFVDVQRAVEHARSMVDEGADIVDVGGESTRPGSEPVATSEEAARVLPVVERLVDEGVVVSVDTTKPGVAGACLDAGAEIVNDVSGLLPPMAAVVADAGAGAVIMHMQGTPATMQVDPQYDEVVEEVGLFLQQRATEAQQLGVSPQRLCIDPGIGFGKTIDHNLALLAGIDRLCGDLPVMVGASRKRFLGTLTGADDPADRDVATAGLSAYLASRGVFALRVHNVAASRDALAPVDAMVRAVP